MREELARAARAGNNHDSQFGDYANLLEGLKQNFADHAATGSGRTRHYVDDAQEAIDLAAHLGLGRLIVLWDDNEITIDGATRLSTSTDMKARFAARGWRTQSIDGHDAEQIVAAISAAKADPRPSLIACRTVIGKGALTLAGSEKTHGAPPGGDEIAAARALAN
jgi:transketolase